MVRHLPHEDYFLRYSCVWYDLGPTTIDDNTVLTLTGTQTTRPQTFLLTKYESLSAKEKADIAEAEGANWWNEFPPDSSVCVTPFRITR